MHNELCCVKCERVHEKMTPQMLYKQNAVKRINWRVHADVNEYEEM